jgi:hypothetical protein
MWFMPYISTYGISISIRLHCDVAGREIKAPPILTWAPTGTSNHIHDTVVFFFTAGRSQLRSSNGAFTTITDVFFERKIPVRAENRSPDTTVL